MIKQKAKITLLITLLISTPLLVAQTNIEDSNDELSPADSQTIDSKNETLADAESEKIKAVKQKETNTTDQVFIPTEEISEDKPVPFPVDI